MLKKKLLVVADYCRADIMYFFSDIKETTDIYFLYYSSYNEIPKSYTLKDSTIIFYHEYFSAFQMLKEIKPEKVLFFDLETFNQIALLSACKELGILTIHVEHGYRNYELSNYLNSIKHNNSSVNNIVSINKIGILERIKNRLFFLLTVLQSKNKNKLLRYKKIREGKSIFESSHFLAELNLIPDRFISFSKKIFDYHKRIFDIKDDRKVDYIGFLYADKYFSNYQFKPKKKIVYIDSNYHTSELFGITPEYISNFFSTLNTISSKYNYELYVKKHPLDKTLAIEESKVKIITDEDFSNNLKDFSIIAGDYSTLFLILIGLPHTLGICFDLFQNKTFNPVAFLEPYKVSYQIKELKKFEELLINENNFANLYKNQLDFKPEYINQFLFKLDGKSKERFNKLILAN